MIPFIIIFLLFVLVILIFSVFFENSFLLYFSSVVLTLVGIYTMVNGILNLNNWFTQSVSVVCLGIAMYIMVTTSFDLIDNET